MPGSYAVLIWIQAKESTKLGCVHAVMEDREWEIFMLVIVLPLKAPRKGKSWLVPLPEV